MNNSTSQLALAAALTAAACKKDAAEGEKTSNTASSGAGSTAGAAPAKTADGPKLDFTGEFGSNAARPVRDGEPTPAQVPEEVVRELSAVAPERIESAFLGRKLPKGQSVTVSFGGEGPNDGLMLTITVGKSDASHRIPPATNGPELVSNLDHTTERLLDELGVPRTGGAL